MHNICQNMWYAILINLFCVKIGTADIAMRHVVQKSVNLLKAYAKHWHQYCNMMLYQCFKRNVLYINDKFTRLQLLRCSKIFLKYRMRVEKAPAEMRSPLPYDYLLNNNKIPGLNMAIISRASGYISIYMLYEEKAYYFFFLKQIYY